MKTFEIVFAGEVRAGYDHGEVLREVRQRFDLDERATAQLFSGQPTILRKGLSRDAALRIKHALEELGLQLSLKCGPSVADEELPKPTQPKASQVAQRMHCPKCGQAQALAEDCIACGTTVREYYRTATRDRPSPLEGDASRPTPIVLRRESRPWVALSVLVASAMLAVAVGLWSLPMAPPQAQAPSLEQIYRAHAAACAGQSQCERLLKTKWDGCVVRSDYVSYGTASPDTWGLELQSFIARLNLCLVDDDGKPVFGKGTGPGHLLAESVFPTEARGRP